MPITELDRKLFDDVFYDTSSSDNPSINRKPNIGMVEQAVKEYKVALSKIMDNW